MPTDQWICVDGKHYQQEGGQWYRMIEHNETLKGSFQQKKTGESRWIDCHVASNGSKDDTGMHQQDNVFYRVRCGDPRNPTLQTIALNCQVRSLITGELGRVVGRGKFPSGKYHIEVHFPNLEPHRQLQGLLPNELEVIENPTANSPTNPAPFFMVKGLGPTNFIHSAPSDAIREAERLARENPGTNFHVLQSIRTVCCGTLTHTKHAASSYQNNDVPF